MYSRRTNWSQTAMLTMAGVLISIPAVSHAQTTAAKSDSARQLTKVTVTGVTGRGSARAAAAVDTGVLRAVAPGSSALKVIERLPGVNMQSVDGFGMYEWSNRVTMRGFQTQQIGQTMDGVPLGDMSYGNFNGLGIGRAVDASNIAATAVTQGTGALGTASGNNLGGVVQYNSADPSATSQFTLQQMGGSYAARRTSLRYDLGLKQFGTNGFNAFVSFSRFDTDKWKGGGDRYSNFPGEQNLFFGQSGMFGKAGQTWHEQLNLKSTLFLGANKITAFYNYASRKESDYMDLSLDVYNNAFPGIKLGPMFDYLTTWSEAKAFAINPQLVDAAYFASAQGARMDHLAYLKGEFQLAEQVRLEVQPYLHRNRGAGDWHAPSYGASYSPDPIMFRQSQYHSDRDGVTTKLSANFTLGSVRNQLEAGGWYESNTVNNRRPRWRMANYQNGPEVDFTKVLRLDYDRTGTIATTMAYVQNTSTLLDGTLSIAYGAKVLNVSADFVNNGNTAVNGFTAPIFADPTRPALSAPTKSGLLPQIGLVYKITAQDEVFGNWSENVNQYPYSPAGGVYNANPATFSYFKDKAKNERATTIEGGVRTKRGAIEAGVTVYTIDYRNRLLGIALCPPTVTCATGFGNVGSVRSSGLEGVMNAELGNGFRLFASATLNQSKFGDDYRTNESDANSVVRTKDKFVQDAPQQIANVALSYGRKGFSTSLSGRYVGERYFTYTNDLKTAGDGAGKVPSYFVSDLSVRQQLGSFGALKSLELQLNVNNLLDARYIATMGSNGYGAMGDNQTLLTGSPRQLFLTLSTKF